MCGSASLAAPIPDNWLGGPYQLYLVPEIFPECVIGWEGFSFEEIEKIFPDRFEAYCVFAFLIGSSEAQHWAGASYAFIDRLAVGILRRMHSSNSWRRLFNTLFTLGKQGNIRGCDIAILLTLGFTNVFWGSMAKLVREGYVIAKPEFFDEEETTGYYPTLKLVEKINNAFE